MNYEFHSDLAVAEKTENKIAKFFQDRNIRFLDKSYNNEYDIKIQEPSGVIYTIEIKEDFMCKDTNNIAIEYESRGKKSGILTTKADYILYVVHEPSEHTNIYIIRTNKLKGLLVQGKYIRKVVGGDKGSFTRSYLMSLDITKQYFKCLGGLC